MAEVNVVIDGRSYPIACDDGQERRVQQLAAYFDARLREVGASLGGGNKPQAMVLAALYLADEIFDLKETVQKVGAENQQLASEPKRIFYQGLSPRDEQELSGAIGRVAERVAGMARRARGT